MALYLMSWVLSVEMAKRFFPETSLFTDDAGAYILVDRIGLEFSHVSNELNALDGYDPKWFTLGKLFAYKAQSESFVHLDMDVFLSKPLPAELLSAPTFAQNPEYFYNGGSKCYLPDEFERVVMNDGHGWLPEEWKWYRQHLHDIQKAVCCGILGGNRIDFIKYYANLAISILDHTSNINQLSALENKRHHSILLEQFLLPACVDYQNTIQDSAYKGVYIHYLFNTLADAYKSEPDVGYMHLMLGNLKNNKSFANILAKKVKRDFPDYYERCIKCARDLNIQPHPARYILLTTFDKREEVSLLEAERIIQKDDVPMPPQYDSSA
jgi:hypothetical protein